MALVVEIVYAVFSDLALAERRYQRLVLNNSSMICFILNYKYLFKLNYNVIYDSIYN